MQKYRCDGTTWCARPTQRNHDKKGHVTTDESHELQTCCNIIDHIFDCVVGYGDAAIDTFAVPWHCLMMMGHKYNLRIERRVDVVVRQEQGQMVSRVYKTN